MFQRSSILGRCRMIVSCCSFAKSWFGEGYTIFWFDVLVIANFLGSYLAFCPPLWWLVSKLLILKSWIINSFFYSNQLEIIIFMYEIFVFVNNHETSAQTAALSFLNYIVEVFRVTCCFETFDFSWGARHSWISKQILSKGAGWCFGSCEAYSFFVRGQIETLYT